MALVTSANENAIRIQNFESLKANFAEWNKFESDYATIDSQIKEVVKTIKEIKAEYIPKIEGVEIVTDVEMEDGEIVGNDVGIYFNDVNLRTLSGSETVSYINELAKSIKDEGGVIFCSEMDRGTELRIEMTDSI